MTCPACQSENIRRSRRRSALEFLFGITGFLPWRCQACETRFRARTFPIRDIVYAHCSTCSNFALKRISPEHVTGLFSPVGRTLGLPALRCEPCRQKFFSIRPLKAKYPAETPDLLQ
jgi:hypothetical protein